MVNTDFNGDGRADILWRNDNGALTDWLAHANGDGGFSGNAAANVVVSPDWRVVATGDFNGDGRSDILWRNDSGALTDWLANGSGGFGGNAAANASVSSDWRIVGTGDFNGDGRADILWRNNNGALTDWLAHTNGDGGFSGNAAANTSVSTEWSIIDTGDFNGDGCDDILWRNSSGAVTNWLAHANGDGGFDGNAAANVAIGTNWTIVGAGDFNGDGRDDMLLRDFNDGRVNNWFAQIDGSFTHNATTGLDRAAAAWHVAGLGDYNGDGRSDILWRNENGLLAEWSSQTGGNFVSNDAAGYSVPLSWQVAPPNPWDDASPWGY